MGKEKKKTDYKLLYHELLEKYDEMCEQLENKLFDANSEIDVIKETIDSLKKENASLRHTIGGYITQMARAKKELSNLKADYELAKKSVNDLTKVSLENKAKVKECITREQETEESYKEQIRVLDHQILKLTEDLADMKTQKDEAERTMIFYKENYEYFKSLPWYKRIFWK